MLTNVGGKLETAVPALGGIQCNDISEGRGGIMSLARFKRISRLHYFLLWVRHNLIVL
jgi:hypothetical protein